MKGKSACGAGRMDKTAGAKDAAARARLLVLAAHDLLDAVGLEGLTIRAVLARTGLARRAFYESFGSKDDLVLAVFTHTLDHAARQFARMIAHEPDPLARLRWIIDAIVLGKAVIGQEGGQTAGLRGAALAREHLRLASTRPAELRHAVAPLIGLIAHQLHEGQKAGVVRSGDADRLAALVYNLVSTTVHAELLTRETAPGAGHAATDTERRARIAAEIWHFCARAIAA